MQMIFLKSFLYLLHKREILGEKVQKKKRLIKFQNIFFKFFLAPQFLISNLSLWKGDFLF